MMKIITVQDTFLITGRGLVVTGQKENDSVEIKSNDFIEILRPDGTTKKSEIAGIEWFNRECFPNPNQREIIALNLKHLTKEDVPIGSEIFLIESVIKNA